MTKYKIKLNDVNNLRDLLEEAYTLSNEQIKQAQDEINKLANATKLTDEVMDSKAKYAKAINDYLSIKDKAIKTKLDIAKLMSEVLSHNGDVAKATEEGTAGKLDFDAIKKAIDESGDSDDGDTKVIQLKKK